MTGAELISQERKRQIDDEDYSAEHDDKHTTGELVMASACYIYDYYGHIEITEHRAFYRNFAQDRWPWDSYYYKPTPKDPIHQLKIAGALIAAEIDRLQRMQ